jgi:hypothetical protein
MIAACNSQPIREAHPPPHRAIYTLRHPQHFLIHEKSRHPFQIVVSCPRVTRLSLSRSLRASRGKAIPSSPPARPPFGPIPSTLVKAARETPMDAFYSGPSAAAYGAARGGGGWRYDSFKNFSHISPAVQTHLKLVRTPLPLKRHLPSPRRGRLVFCGGAQ